MEKINVGFEGILIMAGSFNSLQKNDKRKKNLLQFCTMLCQIRLSHYFLLLSICMASVSCMKKEKPLPLPAPGNAQSQLIDIGKDYSIQVYYSFTNGIVKSDRYDIWDIAFEVDPQKNEIWMNGGENVLIFPSGQSNFNYTLPSILNNQWLYDPPTFEYGKSALGVISSGNHLNELMFVRIGAKDYKLKILEVTPDHYLIEAGIKEAASGTLFTIPKDQNYNYAYYSFTNGIVQPEPKNTEWDMVFTRYRTVFPGLDVDGGDLPYLVNGIFINTANTLGASDSTREYEFANFSMEEAASYELTNRREVIGYNWKLVNINTAEYTILPKRMFLLKDQFQKLWKFHFVSFYDENGMRGKPRFEFERLE